MSDRISIAISKGVADVRLNRADKMNALDAEMFEALYEAGHNLAREDSVRAVVLSGEGRCFCAGLDVTSFAAMASRDSGDSKGGKRTLLSRAQGEIANFAQSAAWVWRELPVPVVAAIHGVAYGGGLQIALGADLRVVAPDAKMSVMAIKWGLVPDMSGTQTLRDLVRLDVAKELTFTGRVISGEEALELGLATRVSKTPLETATEIAMEIARKSPSAIRAGKQLFNESFSGSQEEGLILEARLQGGLIGMPDQIETVKAQMERREARYGSSEE
jgi:enoyl-CoA hydratase/carnithine racemase